MSALDDAITKLQADVTAEATVEQSAITLLNGIPGLITTAVNNALAAGATPAQLASLTALSASIEANTTGLSTAVTANTAPPTS